MKSIFLFFIVALLFGCPLSGQGKYSTFYYQRATLFEELSISSEDTVLLGNSITNGGEWGELFNDMRIKNRGISGDVCMGVYDRLEPITRGKSAKLFLMIGINDMAQEPHIDSIAFQTGIILERIKSASPQTQVYLQSVLPVNDCYGLFDNHTKHWGKINPLNVQLQQLAESKKITFIDLYSHFTEVNSKKMDPIYTNDGLHLMGKGYMRWIEIIKSYISENR